ncbi:hypothetical protein BDN70DRAFT_979759 [Pholiota conissans]|uniref:Protein kinase domain-containing protein n=1 Tax=Pholiota conissans TaxID=109636 RepID=A0A9P5Z2P2_9AGAR|nr:hypothetical protein BDN70DRAFT_979759 [Pholiota conissans]
MSSSSVQIVGLEKHPDAYLYAVGPHNHNQPERHLIRPISFIRNRVKTKVIIATMETTTASEGSFQRTMPVVFKFAAGRGYTLLQHEFGFYTRLASLQGTVIPKCYGFFEAKLGEKMAGCLVLEQCVETSPGSLRNSDGSRIDKNEQKAEYMRKFMQGLCKIHEAGVVLNHDRDETHSIYQGRDPRIIDFSRASMHVCPGACPAPIPAFNSRVNAVLACDGSLGCRELIEMEKDSALVAKKVADSATLAGKISSFLSGDFDYL